MNEAFSINFSTIVLDKNDKESILELVYSDDDGGNGVIDCILDDKIIFSADYQDNLKEFFELILRKLE